MRASTRDMTYDNIPITQNETIEKSSRSHVAKYKIMQDSQ